MTTKICTHCKKELLICEFYKKGISLHSRCKKCLYLLDHRRKMARRIKIIHLMGGKCQKCGYSKNYAAIDIHHINPNEKEFFENDFKERPWEQVIVEIKKCILLCKNCHAETHNEHLNFGQSSKLPQADPHLSLRLVQTGICPICQRDVYGTTYCSTRCAAKDRRKTRRPRKSTLKRKITEMSWTAIGKEYGVSDNAVRKWAKQYGLL